MFSVVAAMAIITTRPGYADEDRAFHLGSKPAWIVLGGGTTGGTVALGGRGALAGGELSLARLREANFVGVYGDTYYDWGTNATWVTGGPEVGHGFASLLPYGVPLSLGLDGGVALRLADGDRELGTTVRLTLGLGVVGIYARYAHVWDTSTDDNVIQIGVLLKMPIWAGGSR
jgi:hypothetical protein